MKMSRETAYSFGVAFGMWAADNGAVFDKPQGRCIDAVAVEESDTYAKLCESILEEFGQDDIEMNDHESRYLQVRQGMIKILEDVAKNMLPKGVKRFQ